MQNDQQQALPAQPPPPLSTTQQQPPHQGVLWKRRDVFKNRWRPRWFCLQANQGVLTYYLLTAAAAPAPPAYSNMNNNNNNIHTGSRNRNNTPTNTTTTTSTATTTTIGRVMSAAAATTRSSCYGTSTATDDSDNGDTMQEEQQGQQQQPRSLLGPPPPPPSLSAAYHHRDRFTSWDSTVSENTVDYDVVPRGSIYLLGGCTVEVNESLSKPREHLFAFTIKSPRTPERKAATSTTEIHLAARSAQARREWVEQLLRVCDYGSTTITASLLQHQARVAGTAAGAGAAPPPPPPPLPLTVSLGGLPVVSRQRSSVEQRLGGDVTSMEKMNEYHKNINDTDNDFFQEALQQQEEISSNHNPTKEEESGESSTTWQSTSSASSLYASVPPILAQDIQHRLNKYLPMIDEESSPRGNDQNNWTKLFDRNGHEAYVTVLPNAQGPKPATPGTTPNTNTTTATTTEGTAVVKTIAFLEHSPRQVFNLLMDPSRRREYESDVRSTCRLQTYNPHTFLELTMYNPIWPMSARELATVVHWQVMSKTKKKDDTNSDDDDNSINEHSLVLVSFSCPQAQALQQPVEPRNVVQAHSLLSLFVLRPMADDTATQMIRLVSLSLDPKLGGFFPVDVAAGSGRSTTNRRHGGGGGRRLQKFVLGQMAGLSTVMARYLQRHEPLPPSGRLTGPLDNDLIIRDIIHHLPDASGTLKTSSSSTFKVLGQPQQDDADGISRDDNDDDSGRWDRSVAPLADVSSGSSLVQPALERQATCLLAPVLFFQMLHCFGLDFLLPPGFALVLFCVAAFYAVRQVVLWHIETIYPSARKSAAMMPIWKNQDTRNRVFGSMTCHFTVDLKGILRFVTNKKQDREELVGQGTAEVSIIHLVSSALARALKKEATLRQHRVALPWLLIDQVVDASSEPIRVSVSENGGRWLTLDDVDSRPVQDIADDLAEQVQEERQFCQNIRQSAPSSKATTAATTRRRQPVLGECLVLATPDMDQFDSEVDFNLSVLPSQAQARNVAVMAVIGGVKLEHYDRRNSCTGTSSTMAHASNGSITGSSAPAPRPVLTLTLTISGPVKQDLSTTADFVTCRRFADDVKLLLQFPEMCE